MLPNSNGHPPPNLHPWERPTGHVFRADAAKELKVLKLDSWEQVLIKERYFQGVVHAGDATHSSILAWRIPWTEKPGGL